MALLALLIAAPAAAQKTDVIILVNGDHITGEVKLLSRGRLQVSTDDAHLRSVHDSLCSFQIVFGFTFA